MMRAFLQINSAGRYPALLSDAVATGFEALRDAAFVGDLSSWLPNAPPVERGPLDDYDKLAAVAGCARDACRAELFDRTEYALNLWKVIFGDKFPA
jgi:hypothetical protein